MKNYKFILLVFCGAELNSGCLVGAGFFEVYRSWRGGGVKVFIFLQVILLEDLISRFGIEGS